jgi:hypothetical protein
MTFALVLPASVKITGVQPLSDRCERTLESHHHYVILAVAVAGLGTEGTEGTEENLNRRQQGKQRD